MKGHEKYNIDSKDDFLTAHFSELRKDKIKIPISKEKSTLLIIDVNKELLNVLKYHFSKNFIVLTATNGFDALRIAWEKNLSLIITGISIPGLDGFGICREIKSSLKLCHIPLIILISKNTTAQKIKGYEVGADIIIARPIDNNLLTAQVNRLIQNRILIKEKYRTQNYMVELGGNHMPKDEQFIKSVRKILKENLADPDLNVKILSEKMNTSSSQLYRILKEKSGHTPVEFIRLLRLQNAYFLLNRRDISVTEACYQSGFNNVSYFIKCFKEKFGETPAIFMNNSIKKDKHISLQ